MAPTKPWVCFVCTTTDIENTKMGTEGLNQKPTLDDDYCSFLLFNILDMPNSSNINNRISSHMQDFSYCPTCNGMITKLQRVLEDLEKLEMEVLRQKYDIEVRLKNSVIDKSVLVNDGTGSESRKNFISFRKEVVNELRSRTVYSLLGSIKKKMVGRTSAQIRVMENISNESNGSKNRILGSEQQSLIESDLHMYNHNEIEIESNPLLLDQECHEHGNENPDNPEHLAQPDSISEEKVLTDFWTLPHMDVDVGFGNEILPAQSQEEVEVSSVLKSEPSDLSNEKAFSQFLCGTCGERFPDYQQLSEHDKIHKAAIASISSAAVGEGKECATCGESFANSMTLRRHVIRKHEDPKFVCNLCQKTFFTTCELSSHKDTHSNIRNFKCDICHKAFKALRVLQRHEKIHSGEKPFQCSFCPARFGSNQHKTLHERTHTGEKPYQCEFCPSRFSTKQHKTLHERTHTGEKPFKCRFCSTAFASSSEKCLHEKRHYGNKPYHCDQCGAGFSSKAGVLVHGKVHKKKVSIQPEETITAD